MKHKYRCIAPSNSFGAFTGSSPMAAAKKFATRLCKTNKMVKITLQRTDDSDLRYFYECRRVKLKTPITIQRGDQSFVVKSQITAKRVYDKKKTASKKEKKSPDESRRLR